MNTVSCKNNVSVFRLYGVTYTIITQQLQLHVLRSIARVYLAHKTLKIFMWMTGMIVGTRIAPKRIHREGFLCGDHNKTSERFCQRCGIMTNKLIFISSLQCLLQVQTTTADAASSLFKAFINYEIRI